MARSARVTILFTDVVGSTELLERLGDEAGTDVLRRHFAILRRAVTSHGGREVKNLGDGLMVVFTDATAAARCAVAMQRGIARYNRTSMARLGLRVGVNTGTAQLDGGDYFGIPVVIAKRLCDRCEAGQVLATAGFGDEAGHDAQPLGELSLKGLSAPIAAVSLAWTETPLTVVPRRMAS